MQIIYARIKRTSKYFGQNPPDDRKFPVIITGPKESYGVTGNNNQYRLADVELFVTLRNGDFVQIRR